MIKKMAWNTFKNTGDVNTFLELKQIQKKSRWPAYYVQWPL